MNDFATYLIAGLLIGVLILGVAKATTRVIAHEWFGAKRRHLHNVMRDCDHKNGEG